MKSKTARGFTVAELLVVIGLIAVLMGLLLPSVSAARDRANEVACAARLRTLGGMLAAYTAQDRGRAVLPVGGRTASLSGWPEVLGLDIENKIRVCPNGTEEEGGLRVSYMVNYFYGGRLPIAGLTYYHLATSKVALAGENRPGSGELVVWPSVRGVNLTFGWTRHRGGKGGNILWMDYHVSNSHDEPLRTVYHAWTLGSDPD